jgi:CheY-like chemotaxis protein
LVWRLLQKVRIVSNPRMILVVDDDELLAQMIAELLRGEGYQVWTAGNGLDGYASYYQHQAETVVTDIDMPEFDGFQMMRCIRAINPAARAIYMSGAPEQYRRTLATEAQKFGAAVLRKPFEETELLKVVPSFTGKKTKPWSSVEKKKFVWREAV